MAARKPLVIAAGQISELPVGDSIDAPISPIEQVVLSLLKQNQHHEQTLSRPGTTAGQSVRAWLTSSEDNEIWQLEGVTVNASCEVDQITFYLSCEYFESGNINVNFEVR
jgi:hypothetical protein